MKDYKWVVWSNQINDYPVTVMDIDVTAKIWGKDIVMLKGKMVKKRPVPVLVVKDLVKVPKEFLKLHKEVMMTMDIYLVNQIPFFVLISCAIYFRAVHHLANQKVEWIFCAFKEIYKILSPIQLLNPNSTCQW
jgi:hypothetical protein